MTIYKIDARIAEILMSVDEETGELPEGAFDELSQLNEDREVKVENAACLYVNLAAEAKAIRDQEQALAERRKATEKRMDSIERYIDFALGGNDFSSPRVAVKHRKSVVVEIDDKVFWQNPAAAFVRQKAPEVDKAAVKAALKDGGIVPGASLVERRTVSIK